MPVSVFLADFRFHGCETVGDDDSTAFWAGYANSTAYGGEPEVCSRLFAEPNILLEELRRRPPDILMLTDHAWNEGRNLQVARLAKEISPDIFVAIVAPHAPIDLKRQSQLVASNSDIDLCVFCDGESSVAEVVHALLAAGTSHRDVRPRRIVRSLEEVSGALVLYRAVRCLDEEVHRKAGADAGGRHGLLRVYSRGDSGEAAPTDESGMKKERSES